MTKKLIGLMLVLSAVLMVGAVASAEVAPSSSVVAKVVDPGTGGH